MRKRPLKVRPSCEGRTAPGWNAEGAALLLKSGAKVDPKDVNGNTPLSTAVFESQGRGEVIKMFALATAKVS
jgi:ankyrin repeat protein